MKKGKVFVLTFVLLLALAVPTAAVALEIGNGTANREASVNLTEVGDWCCVKESGTFRPMQRIALTDGMVIASGERIVCDTFLPLKSGFQCTFDITCSTRPEYAGSVTKLRLYEGDHAGAVPNYIGAFYKAGSDLDGQLIKTFNGGNYFLAIQNDGPETIKVTDLIVSWCEWD